MSDPWLISTRLALYLSLMAMFGMPLFLLQTISNRGWQPLLMSRIVRLAGWASLAGLVASALGLWAMARSMSGSNDLMAAWQIARTLLTETDLGLTWVIRVGLLIAAAALAFLLQNKTPAGIASLTVLGGAALVTLSWGGHGVMTEGVPGWVHLGSDMLHLLIAGAWVGAIATLILVASYTAGAKDDPAAHLLAETSSGFARLGTAIVVLLAITGAANYLFVVGPTFGGLVDSLYGRLLLIKLGAFVGMLVLAAFNRFKHTPALEKALTAGNPSSAVAILRRSLWLELSLATAVMLLVAWLGALGPME